MKNSVFEVIFNADEQTDIRTIRMGLSTMLVTIFPRYALKKYIKQSQSEIPGLYILFNEVSNGDQSVYIGEAENIGNRLKQHENAMAKDFWTHTIVFQETSNKLNKAHYKNLEYRVYRLAKESERAYVVNKVSPTQSSLSLGDQCLIDEYLRIIRNTLVVFNYKFLEPKIIGAFEEDLDVYYIYYHGATAKLRVKSQSEMILLAGSTCTYKPLDELPKTFAPMIKQRDEAIKKGEITMIEDTDLIRINKDIVFDSENEACAFVTLRDDIDGCEAWKYINGYGIYSNKK